MTTANLNDNGSNSDDPKVPPKMVNPYVSVDTPDEPQLCGFGMSFLGVLSQMVNQYQIMPQQMVDALTPPAAERAAILRARASDMMKAADDLEKFAASPSVEDGGSPKWGSKWKN